MKIFYLTITSYKEIGAIGAEHYYGIMASPSDRKKIELTKKISAKTALYLNKKSGFIKSLYRFKRGDSTERFDSKEEVKNAAYKIAKEEKAVLIEGSCCIASCQEILFAPEEVKKMAEKANFLYLRFLKMDGYNGDYKKASKIDDDWMEIISKIKKYEI